MKETIFFIIVFALIFIGLTFIGGCSHLHEHSQFPMCSKKEYHDCGEDAREGWACVEIETPIPCNITKWWQK